MSRILIAGCGYVGTALAGTLVADSHTVWGLRRHWPSAPSGVRPIEADLSIPATLAGLPADPDFVFYLASPGGTEDPLYRVTYVDGLRNLLEALKARGCRPRRVLFVSSTAVYGQTDGAWVDESSPTEPSHFSGARLLEAEGVLRDGPFAATAVRFGGIYGPRRTGLIDRIRTGRAHYREGRYTNRIHRDDCVGVLRHLMARDRLESLYLGVDCEPAEEGLLHRWLAGAMGSLAPRPADSDTATPRGNKRCSNERLLRSGYAFLYPTFREGYAALIAEQR